MAGTGVARHPAAEGRTIDNKPASGTADDAPDATAAAAAATPRTPAKRRSAAGPRLARVGRATPPRAKLEPTLLDRYLAIVVGSLEDDKAENVVVLDLAGRASFADRMVIATGLADRQISAMAAHLETKLEQAGVRRIRIEGAGGSDWVLMDAGDIVVHLFKPEARALYALERMWGAELDEPAEPADAADLAPPQP